jgi:hypothetical protein
MLNEKLGIVRFTLRNLEPFSLHDGFFLRSEVLPYPLQSNCAALIGAEARCGQTDIFVPAPVYLELTDNLHSRSLETLELIKPAPEFPRRTCEFDCRR